MSNFEHLKVQYTNNKANENHLYIYKKVSMTVRKGYPTVIQIYEHFKHMYLKLVLAYKWQNRLSLLPCFFKVPWWNTYFRSPKN